jgi:hypothetical protein
LEWEIDIMGFLVLAAVALYAAMAMRGGDKPEESGPPVSMPVASDADARAAVVAFARLYPGLSDQVKRGARESLVVSRVQERIGVKPDGYLGKDTIYALQRYGWDGGGPSK